MLSKVLEFLFQQLSSVAGADSIYADYAPKTASNPAIIYQLVSDAFDPMLKWQGNDRAGNIQIRIYTDSASGGRSAANAIREDVKNLLDLYDALDLGDGVRLSGSMVTTYIDDYDVETNHFGALCNWEFATEANSANVP